MKVAICVALLGVALVSCQQPEGQSAGAGASKPAATAGEGQVGVARTLPDGLVIEDVELGHGIAAVEGKRISVHYTGTFPDGHKFDSSRDRGEPISFVLGTGAVVRGWDEGLVGMRIGGKRKLIIPPALGYGANDYGPIPGNSTLHFDVEMVDIQP